MAEHEMKDIVCPHCNKSFNSLERMKDHLLTSHRGIGLPTPKGQIELSINEIRYTLDVKSNWTLYDVIHDQLGLTGAKQFCDRGACGSCTVIMDGEPVLSCMILAVECDGKSIETVEGIAEKEHPLIESYAKNHAMQCGYCTPGFVTTSKAILDKNPEPNEQEIKTALSGNLCRCGTYPQHTIAVMEAAESLKTNKQGER
jgi:aerobic-type carbon monoxide dehydrogenase small subunit (CoxS/CutS family)